ncbi:MAG: AbrB/MazE/SpoVT family DNA-binding domain-containing protein [Nanoarchaeota archaeon]|nr:AbrB/MazE/SpoVT family DNA-binding domain-containing protein [Nanoarchaeota archaeon]MBU1501696.1 AbrB/MazE/SpoVT family DNA-binding domain-containing protein [Nanoarchaeota archaeon]MBU2459047.1 AbrB/MazE/SpoVT family DNA-binding domain-containing protein [Nanoarchaeota archaeon]
MIIKRPLGEKGQVVIPKNIRTLFNLRKGENIIFEVNDNNVTIKPEKKEDIKNFLDEFFNSVSKENITLEDIRKAEDESYDLP